MAQESQRAGFACFLVGALALGVAMACALKMEELPYRLRSAELHRLMTRWLFGSIIGAACFWRIERAAASKAGRSIGLAGFFVAAGTLFFGGGSGAHSFTSDKNICINNLRRIDGAKEQWALEKGFEGGTGFVEAEVAIFLKGGKIPECPKGGKYSLGRVNEAPRCLVSGHTL